MLPNNSLGPYFLHLPEGRMERAAQYLVTTASKWFGGKRYLRLPPPPRLMASSQAQVYNAVDPSPNHCRGELSSETVSINQRCINLTHAGCALPSNIALPMQHFLFPIAPCIIVYFQLTWHKEMIGHNV